MNNSIPWLYLLLSGLIEIGWIYSLKYTEGFTKIVPMIFYGVFGFFSAFFLSKALKNIDVGTAYAVWMGIAIVGITTTGILFLKENYSILKIVFILFIAIGIAGLKFLSAAK